MTEIAVMLAEGFEEIEGLTVVDICRRCGIGVTTVSITDDKNVMGSHGIPVIADKTFGEVDFGKIDMRVLPGGKKGTDNLEACEPLLVEMQLEMTDGKYEMVGLAARQSDEEMFDAYRTSEASSRTPLPAAAPSP